MRRNMRKWVVAGMPVAVSAEAGTVELALHQSNFGAHQILRGRRLSLQADDDPPLGKRIVVEKVSIDFLIELGLLVPEEIGLVWMDV